MVPGLYLAIQSLQAVTVFEVEHDDVKQLFIARVYMPLAIKTNSNKKMKTTKITVKVSIIFFVAKIFGNFFNY